MNYDDVFQKSDLGREEIKSQTQGMLPREARTLLIMIDGKRNYGSYLNTLDQSKMFADFGGVTPLFELLLELDYIELVGGAKRPSKPMSAAVTQPVPESAYQPQQAPQTAPISADINVEVEKEFDRTFNDRPSGKKASVGSSIGSLFKNKLSGNRYETIRSDLATYIERNSPPAEAWGYLLMLEQCQGSQQLTMLVEEIQSKGSAELARGMSGFMKRIQH